MCGYGWEATIGSKLCAFEGVSATGKGSIYPDDSDWTRAYFSLLERLSERYPDPMARPTLWVRKSDCGGPYDEQWLLFSEEAGKALTYPRPCDWEPEKCGWEGEVVLYDLL